jgi:putative endonuclease
MAESATQSVGRRTERLAEQHLSLHGLQTINRNFRCRHGEIDLIMLDGPALVFVEVRYRKPNRFGTAAATVNQRKQQKLTNTAAMFLAKHPFYRDHPVRFDIVGLDGPDIDHFKIQWHKDAFRPRSLYA